MVMKYCMCFDCYNMISLPLIMYVYIVYILHFLMNGKDIFVFVSAEISLQKV